MVENIRTTAELVSAFESKLEAEGFVVVDRLSMWDGVAARKGHAAAFVEVAESTDAGGRGGRAIFVRDTVRVGLLFSTNPRDQKTSQAEALTTEDRVRAALVERSWGGPLDVTHTRTRRGPAPRPAIGWYLIDLEFSTFRTVVGADPV